jgi:hypothetical protein
MILDLLDNVNVEREKLLAEVVNYFSTDSAVLGIFLGGSLPAGTADACSDIDLRVVVTPEEHARFVSNRLDMPKQWNGFLFNEWMEGAQHCVSHFRPFFKTDIFYHNQADFCPSPWYGLPTTILYDPKDVVSKVIESSPPFAFEVNEKDIDWLISKGLAAAHEVFRRARRGELLYAQNLLEEFRSYVIRADDWLHRRVPTDAADLKLERRLSQSFVGLLNRSYVPTDAHAIETAMLTLLAHYREQVIELHERFDLSRPLENDLYAVSVLL